MNKKGALELSITGIVVMIIAITVLSLAIVFIRGMFQRSTETFEQQFKVISDQVQEDLKRSGELFTVQVYKEDLVLGRATPMAIGIKNTAGVTRCFGLAVVCRQGWGENGCDSGGTATECVVGGNADLTDITECTPSAWFMQGQIPKGVRINPGETRVINVNLQPNGLQPDKYPIEFQVYEDTADTPSTDCSTLATSSLMGSKSLDLNVVAG